MRDRANPEIASAKAIGGKSWRHYLAILVAARAPHGSRRLLALVLVNPGAARGSRLSAWKRAGVGRRHGNLGQRGALGLVLALAGMKSPRSSIPSKRCC